MSLDSDEQESHYEDWWDQEAVDETKNLWKLGVELFLKNTG